ncbi:hypothetical protein, partial [Burkholderia contaminans]|uniref:hypothetical protein n=1 Tax=Burkholderia contaminans TaxID=488447 RepID=UPI002D803B37
MSGALIDVALAGWRSPTRAVIVAESVDTNPLVTFSYVTLSVSVPIGDASSSRPRPAVLISVVLVVVLVALPPARLLLTLAAVIVTLFCAEIVPPTFTRSPESDAFRSRPAFV